MHEWAAIILLLLGGFFVGIGWIVGLILLWKLARVEHARQADRVAAVAGRLASAMIVASSWASPATGALAPVRAQRVVERALPAISLIAPLLSRS